MTTLLKPTFGSMSKPLSKVHVTLDHTVHDEKTIQEKVFKVEPWQCLSHLAAQPKARPLIGPPFILFKLAKTVAGLDSPITFSQMCGRKLTATSTLQKWSPQSLTQLFQAPFYICPPQLPAWMLSQFRHELSPA